MPSIPVGRAIAASTVLSALLFTAACTGAENGGAPSTSSASTMSAGTTPTEQNPPQPGMAFTADPTITRVRPLRFDTWSRTAADRITVNFQIGSPECYGVDATTDETDTAVTVHLRTGTLPKAVGHVCSMIAMFGSLEIPLNKPLGDRKVLSAG
ncbi:MAG: hypothetical protein J2P18_06965 [Nocardia sp.]|nr:hypothetical protein [Nocardia sp.]